MNLSKRFLHQPKGASPGAFSFVRRSWRQRVSSLKTQAMSLVHFHLYQIVFSGPVAKLVDAPGLGPDASNGMRVRVPPGPPFLNTFKEVLLEMKL